MALDPEQAKIDGGTISRTEQVVGYVTEMFCSVQGEGLYVGERHLFLRTAGCNWTVGRLHKKVHRHFSASSTGT